MAIGEREDGVDLSYSQGGEKWLCGLYTTQDASIIAKHHEALFSQISVSNP